MKDISDNTLENIADTADPGDETARRYRYQWTYAAILCCMLLDDTEDIQEIFCEHYEDILLKHLDGLYSGYQIKTRALDQEPWKANNSDLKSSIIKFIKNDYRFPTCFKNFYFLTNHPLYSAKNGHDILYILDNIKRSHIIDGVSSPVLRYIKEIASEAECTLNQAYMSFKKINASHDLPKLRDCLIRLIGTLTDTWPSASECSYDDVRRAGIAIVEECGRASSLSHYDVLPAYISAMNDSVNAELKAYLDNKRINKDRLLSILQQGLDGTLPLYCDPELLVEPGTGDNVLLKKKLNAGGFSAVSLNSAECLRDRADYMGLTLIQKHGQGKGLQRYNALRTMVLADAATAYEAASLEDPFGKEMLVELRNRFRLRRAENTELFGCTNEHLEGLAYSLTSQCKILWSINRPWEEE